MADAARVPARSPGALLLGARPADRDGVLLDDRVGQQLPTHRVGRRLGLGAVGARSSISKYLPARTPSRPSKPRCRSASVMLRPAGSLTTGLSVT